MKLTRNKDLQRLNTFGLKAKAACCVDFSAAEELVALDWDSLPRPLLPLGQGSNLLFTKDFPGTVLHSCIEGIEVDELRCSGDDVYVRAGSGVVMDDFCHWAAHREFWGVENLSGIPGTVGAAPVQNVGAYGVEAADVVERVECFDIATRSFVSLGPGECAFGYRDSFFKHNRGRYIVVSVLFHLYRDFRPRLDYGNLRQEVERNIENFSPTPDPYRMVYGGACTFQPPMPLSPMLVRDTVKALRESKLPDPSKVGSAGSFFKNPVVSQEVFLEALESVRREKGDAAVVPHFDLEGGLVKIPAAFLIDFCGLKGVRCGGAGTWEKQPLVIVNASGRASADEILELENKIIDCVRDTFGIELSPEVDHI